MAFQLPQQTTPQRYPPTSRLNTTEAQPERYVEDTEEWVLFSPSRGSYTAHTPTNSTERTPRTAGLSHLSDFGSLNTIARSHDEHVSQVFEDDEGTELDSLDNHLHAFRESTSQRRPSRLDQSGGTVLPAHDGLGMFAASSSPVREHLYQFEQYNPRRRRRRTDDDEGTPEEAREEDRMRRIQEWRMEHSRVVLDEIEKATRRRRMSSSTENMKRSPRHDEDTATMSGTAPEIIESKDGLEDGLPASNVPAEEGKESLWQRITRRFIRDFMGIDDSMLSMLFGESLPQSLMEIPEATTLDTDLTYHERSLSRTSRNWEDRLFERLARELGSIMHQLTEHPGAFSTYLRTLEPPEYAGISGSSRSPDPPAAQNQSHDNSRASSHHLLNSSMPNFAPTLPVAIDNTAVSAADTNADSILPRPLESEYQQQEREYWERELDVKMVFGFLRSRFSSSSRRPPSSFNSHTASANQATTSTASAATRAALIRAHHPLVSRHQDVQRRRSSLSHRSNLARSARRNSCRSHSYRSGSMSGSSRNFWGLESSVGGTSGSALGVGTWGEV